MVRRVILALSAVCLVLLGVIAGQELEHRRPSSSAAAGGDVGDGGHGGHVAQDWSSLPQRDLTIAGLFLAARRDGIGAALDSLEVLVRTDSAIRALGDSRLHHVVHTMGRFAIRENGNDPRVFGACRPSFRSGCFHGVMEGYFAAGAPDDSAALSALCASLVADDAIARLRLECAHGMGHGLAARGAHDPSNALPKCDVLRTAHLRRSCYDGVFMEAVNFATSGLPAPTMSTALPTMHNGFDTIASAHDIHGQGATTLPTDTSRPATSSRRTYEFTRSMCVGRDARHQAACWYYQPILFLADAAAAFCHSLPQGERTDCFPTLGAAIAPLHPNAEAAGRVCDALAGALASACRTGARRDDFREAVPS